MQRQDVDPQTMCALLPDSVLELADLEEISASISGMADMTSHLEDSQCETVLQGFLALLVLQGTCHARVCLPIHASDV